MRYPLEPEETKCIVVVEAMLPNESKARAELGDKVCGRLVLEFREGEDEPEVWEKLAKLTTGAVQPDYEVEDFLAAIEFIAR